MAAKVYSGRELSAFCLQISILLKAAVPLDEGLYLMAEDAPTEEEKKLLHTMGEDVELGDPFFESLDDFFFLVLFLLYQDKRKKYIKITKKAEVQNPRFLYHINLYAFLTFNATYFFVSVSSSFRFGSFLASRTILYT